jgi:hypothetical protein
MAKKNTILHFFAKFHVVLLFHELKIINFSSILISC